MYLDCPSVCLLGHIYVLLAFKVQYLELLSFAHTSCDNFFWNFYINANNLNLKLKYS